MPTPHNCYLTNATLVCILSYIKSAVNLSIYWFIWLLSYRYLGNGDTKVCITLDLSSGHKVAPLVAISLGVTNMLCQERGSGEPFLSSQSLIFAI